MTNARRPERLVLVLYLVLVAWVGIPLVLRLVR